MRTVKVAFEEEESNAGTAQRSITCSDSALSDVSPHTTGDLDDTAVKAPSSTGESSKGKGTLRGYMNMHMAKGPACLRHISFEYQVIIALMIPVCFVIGILTSSMVEQYRGYNFIRDHIELVESGQAFEAEFMKERAMIGPYLGRFPNNTAATTAALAAFHAQQQKVDVMWERYAEVMSTNVQDGVIDGPRAALRTKIVKGLELYRSRVESRNITGTDARAYITETIIVSQSMIRALMKNKQLTESLPSLVGFMMARHYTNYLGAVRGAGNEIVSLDGPLGADLHNEFKYVVTSLHHTAIVLLDVVVGSARDGLNEWLHENADTAHLFGMMEAVSNHTFTFTSAEWYAATTKSITEVETIILERVKAELGKEERKQTQMAIGLMVIVTVISVAAATFIVYWQIKIAESIAHQQQTLVQVSDVVSSFVPKAFLKTMGTRSVMQISTGQHVNVATTMLFSDIRNFTNLSERMTNEKLFFWLQRYFALMTRVTDKHNGTIDKFIGDAIFSFFPRPTDAVRCGIDMQSVVVFLNSTLCPQDLVQLGVGIHHGVVAFGVFGDESRRTCTMVSSEVNLASRLEGLTKKYGVRILVSDQAMSQVNTDNFRHEVMNPLDLGTAVKQVEDGAVSGGSGGAYAVPPPGAVDDDDVANAKDVIEADEEDEVEVSRLGHRLLGEVAVKGSNRVIRIFEVFQADEVQVVKYKSKTKETFEEAVHLQLKMAANRRSEAHTVEYNALRRRSDSEAVAAQEEAELEEARRSILSPDSMSVSGTSTLLHFGTASIMNATSPLSASASDPLDVDETTSRALGLLSDCARVAMEYGVEDPVVVVKRAQLLKNGGKDVFNSK